MVIQGIAYPSDFEAKKSMIEAGKRLAACGCMPAGDGSMSVRVGPNAVWVTECGSDKAVLCQGDFIRVDMAGKQQPGGKSRQVPGDLALHLKLYAADSAVRSVVHAYPQEAAAAAQCRDVLCVKAVTPALKRLGSVRVLPGNADENAGTGGAGNGIAGEARAVIFREDGVVSFGGSVSEAVKTCEAVEYLAGLTRKLDGAACGNAGCSPENAVNGAGDAGQGYCSSESVVKRYAAPAQVREHIPAAGEVIMPGLTGIIRPSDVRTDVYPDVPETGYGNVAADYRSAPQNVRRGAAAAGCGGMPEAAARTAAERITGAADSAAAAESESEALKVNAAAEVVRRSKLQFGTGRN